jgi:hypothetical protein
MVLLGDGADAAPGHRADGSAGLHVQVPLGLGQGRRRYRLLEPEPARDPVARHTLIRSPAHSEKPDWGYELIEDYFPNLPKIELNARRRRDGWDAWGFEAPDDDEPEQWTPAQPLLPAATAAASSDDSDVVTDAGEIIRRGYATNTPLAEIARQTGLSAKNAQPG